MSQVEAIYQDGVFKPLGQVQLNQNQRVFLTIEPVRASDALAWLEQMRQLHQAIIAAQGCFPDSTLDIAEDRMR